MGFILTTTIMTTEQLFEKAKALYTTLDHEALRDIERELMIHAIETAETSKRHEDYKRELEVRHILRCNEVRKQDDVKSDAAATRIVDMEMSQEYTDMKA